MRRDYSRRTLCYNARMYDYNFIKKSEEKKNLSSKKAEHWLHIIALDQLDIELEGSRV